MKCQAKNKECEFAQDFMLMDQYTGKELQFTLCGANAEGKPCPYHWYHPEMGKENERQEERNPGEG